MVLLADTQDDPGQGPGWSSGRTRSAEDAEAVLARLLDAPEPPTALVAGNNLVTVTAMRAARAS
ncbi:MAG: hypothetical protein QM699_16785 [Amaricoccus sp.]|uniref:hypothetical protein n=1 Tax=Amaricoccus sp. TaxID=1872485 RepID=UPI0039E53F39